MKNVHLIPTDKSSRLVQGKNLYFYKEGIGKNFIDIDEKFQNIYITSDEEIKEGDKGWLLENNGITKNINQYDCTNGLGGIYPTDRKIILTTDQDLIADGVQAIDDEFLEWFVKNPNCEWVEVKNISIKVVKGYNNNGEIDCYYTNGYEIIIPQEEPKQETLEEAAIKYATEANGVIVNQRKKQQFTAGAKWQAERMYTYDEMRTIAYNAYCLGQLDSPTEGKFNEWIQKFKKK